MSLNDRNNLTLWIVVASNVFLLCACAKWDELNIGGTEALYREARTLLPIGIGGIVATVLNQFLSVETKTRLVYWRWHHGLPGHRAFSEHADADARIDTTKLRRKLKGGVPDEPAAQNAAWYALYRGMRDDVMVKDANRVFLLMRDYASLSALFIPLLGITALVLATRPAVALCFLAWLVAQYLLVRQAAANAGVRLVRDVLAIKATATR